MLQAPPARLAAQPSLLVARGAAFRVRPRPVAARAAISGGAAVPPLPTGSVPTAPAGASALALVVLGLGAGTAAADLCPALARRPWGRVAGAAAGAVAGALLPDALDHLPTTMAVLGAAGGLDALLAGPLAGLAPGDRAERQVALVGLAIGGLAALSALRIA